MKRIVLIFVVGLGLVLTGQNVMAADETMAGDGMAAMEDMKADMGDMKEEMGEMAADAAVVDVGNKICPVGGEAIEEGKSIKVIHNGKAYNLCCAMCEPKFTADPDKYSAVADEEVMNNSKEMMN